MYEDKHCLDALTDYARDFASSLGWRGVVTTSVPLGPAGVTHSCRHNLCMPEGYIKWLVTVLALS